MTETNEWRRGILHDLITLQRGHDLPLRNLNTGIIPVMGSFGIIGYNSVAKAKGPGVTIGRSGSIGEVTYVGTDYWPHNTSLYVINFHGNVPRYVYYFKSMNLSSYSSGSAVPTLNRNHIHPIPVKIPPIIEQKAIANVLGLLDDKIALNKQINKTLEQIVQTIFRHWFIDFEFPDEKSKPYKSSGGEMVYNEELRKEIPKEWEVSDLSKEFDLVMGQSPPGSSYNEIGEGVIFFQGRTDFGYRFPSLRMFCTAPTRFARKGDTLVSVRAPVGDINMALQECCIGRGLAAIRHKSNHSSYTYYFVRTLKPTFDYFEHEGTVFGSISKANFAKIRVLAPPREAINSFQNLVDCMDMKIEDNTLQMRTLSSIRDSLLAKLISGKIRFPMEAR